MRKILLKALRSRRQLDKLDLRRLVSAGFTDDGKKYFTFTFDASNGMKQDLTISFETRTPRIYLSDCYAEE